MKPIGPATFTSFAFVARSRNVTPQSGKSSGETRGGGCWPRRGGALVAGLVSCDETTAAEASSAIVMEKMLCIFMRGRNLTACHRTVSNHPKNLFEILERCDKRTLWSDCVRDPGGQRC